jgi:hypothetical protein
MYLETTSGSRLDAHESQPTRMHLTMRRYNFDLREDDRVVPDDEGIELSALKVRRKPPDRWLIWRVVPCWGAKDGAARRMAIEVRDDPVLQVRFTFDVDKTRQQN